MRREEMVHLRTGDFVQYVSDDVFTGRWLIVENYGDHVVFVRNSEIANSPEWFIVGKVKERT